MAEKHKTLQGLKFQMASLSKVRSYRSNQTPGLLCFQDGFVQHLIVLIPLNKLAVMLRTVLIESNGVKKHRCLQVWDTLAPWICMLSFLVHDYVWEPWLTLSVFLPLINIFSPLIDVLMTGLGDEIAPLQVFLITWMGQKAWELWCIYYLGYYSVWELPRNSCLKVLLQVFRKFCLLMMCAFLSETCKTKNGVYIWNSVLILQ